MTLTKSQKEARKSGSSWHGEETITEVTNHKGGFSISCKGSGFFLSRKNLGDAKPPQVGDTILVYTHRGWMIRGVDLRGEPLYYSTDEELEAEQKEWVAKHRADQLAQFEKDRRKLDRAFAVLPDVFQRRISWFRAWNPDFRWQNEAYEMSVCTDAVKIAAAMKTPKGVQRFSKMRHSTQQRKVPGLYDGHSGNSFGAAVNLAYLYLTEPLMVIAEHGALTPLVGCDDFGCVHPRPPDVMEAIERLAKEEAA